MTKSTCFLRRNVIFSRLPCRTSQVPGYQVSLTKLIVRCPSGSWSGSVYAMISLSKVALILSLFISCEDKMGFTGGRGKRSGGEIAWTNNQPDMYMEGRRGPEAPALFMASVSIVQVHLLERDSSTLYLEPLGAVEARIVHPGSW